MTEPASYAVAMPRISHRRQSGADARHPKTVHFFWHADPWLLTCVRGVLCAGRLRIGGSQIGGIKETQEMLDFCSKHNITCEIESIDIDYVNTAMERLMKNDVHYRFVIDVQGSLIQ